MSGNVWKKASVQDAIWRISQERIFTVMSFRSVWNLMKLMEEYKIPIKVRACDTMGYGVNYPGAVIPRSVPGIIYALHTHAGVPHEMIEWHGHNDFYKAVVNSTTAWLYGCSGVNTSCLVSESVPVIHLWRPWYLSMHS